MKKLEPPSARHESIEGVRIVRDDVEFLIELFRRDVGPSTLSDDHFEFESLDEFIKQRGEKPAKLEVEAKATDGNYGTISATFEGNSVWLYGYRNTPFHEAKEFLLSKRPWSYHALNPWPWIFVAMVAGNVLSAVAQLAKEKQQPMPDWPLYLLGTSLTLTLVGFLYRRLDFGLRLARRHEGGFWKRHAEKIVLMLVGASITAVIGWLAKLIGH